MTTNLVLHCGARHVERRAVEKAATPAASETWVPVPHHRLLEQVEATIISSGMTVVNQAHALWNDGLRYFGLMEVANGQAHEDYGLVIGLRNSHDKSFPAAIALGSPRYRSSDRSANAGTVRQDADRRRSGAKL